MEVSIDKPPFMIGERGVFGSIILGRHCCFHRDETPSNFTYMERNFSDLRFADGVDNSAFRNYNNDSPASS